MTYESYVIADGLGALTYEDPIFVRTNDCLANVRNSKVNFSVFSYRLRGKEIRVLRAVSVSRTHLKAPEYKKNRLRRRTLVSGNIRLAPPR